MSTDRGSSAVLRLKRSIELSNEKRERLKNALARVKGNPDSEYAARLVQSARKEAGREASVVKRQISRIHEDDKMPFNLIKHVIDGDAVALSEAIDEALRSRIDETLSEAREAKDPYHHDVFSSNGFILIKGKKYTNPSGSYHEYEGSHNSEAHRKRSVKAIGQHLASKGYVKDKLGDYEKTLRGGGYHVVAVRDGTIHSQIFKND